MLKLICYVAAFAILAAVAFTICQGGSNMARQHNAALQQAIQEN